MDDIKERRQHRDGFHIWNCSLWNASHHYNPYIAACHGLRGCCNTVAIITKHSSALYIGMAKVLPIIDVLGYDGQNSSFSFSSSLPYSDSTPITQKGSHIST